MKEFKTILQIILILAIFLGLWVIWDRYLRQDDAPQEKVIVPGDSAYTTATPFPLQPYDTDTVFIEKEKPPQLPIIIYVDTSKDQVDTTAIKHRYQKLLNEKDSLIASLQVKRKYADTIKNDSIQVEGIFRFAVYKNRLINRHYRLKNNRSKVITRNVNVTNEGFYYGFNAGYMLTPDFLFGANLRYQKENNIYGLDVVSGFDDTRLILFSYSTHF